MNPVRVLIKSLQVLSGKAQGTKRMNNQSEEKKKTGKSWGKEKKKAKEKNKSMFYHKNTPLQLEREFLSWPQWPLPVLLEIRCTKLQFCLELEWAKDRMDIRPHIFSLHSVSWLLWAQVTFLMLFQHSHLPCMSPSATQRSEKGNTTRDVVRRDCHGHTLEETSFAKPRSTQPAPGEGCLTFPLREGRCWCCSWLASYQAFGDLDSRASYRACLWAYSRKDLGSPALDIPQFLIRTSNVFLLPRSDRRQKKCWCWGLCLYL